MLNVLIFIIRERLTTLASERPCEEMTAVATGLVAEAKITTLRSLGAIEY